jgi:hypothetical protein
VVEAHLRLLLTERCLDKALVHQDRISYSLLNDFYTIKTRGNSHANFHKWLSKKIATLSDEMKEFRAKLDELHLDFIKNREKESQKNSQQPKLLRR